VSSLSAWVLDFGQGRRAAVAQRQQLHLMYAPQVQPMPLAPVGARDLFLWNERCLPVLDFGAWHGESPTSARGLLGVYAYHETDGGAVEMGALWLAAPPLRVDVDDTRACDLPDSLQSWRRFSLSCFRDGRFGPVPIVDLGRIFAAPRACVPN
jgi:hypothetical protein